MPKIQPSTDELRSSVRFPIKLPVAITTDSLQEHQAETENISAGGVLFTVDAEMAPGSKIEFAIAMPANVLGTTCDVMVKCVGRVVRCAEEGERKSVAAVIDEYRFDRN